MSREALFYCFVVHLKKIKLDDGYYAQYYGYIDENKDELSDMFLGNMPGFENYRDAMKEDYHNAIKKNGIALTNNEKVVYTNIISCAMHKVGVK